MPRLMTTMITSLIAVLVFPLIVFAAINGTPSTCGDPAPTADIHATTPWDDEQLTNASTIITVGRRKGIPVWGQVIAVAVAMQESRLRNLPDGTDDSIGLFQQRPSQGWGTARQLTSPAHQAGAFFDALQAVPDWETLPLTAAAQDVQKSATPNAYTQWTDQAFDLVVHDHTAEPSPPASPADHQPHDPDCQDDEGDGLPDTPSALPPDYTLPADASPTAAAAITWALHQLGTPYSYGGDCTAPHSEDPARQCDCSSLVQQAYHAAGLTLPRTTSQQVHAGIAILNPNDLASGDLVFIPGSDGTPTAPRHVGIYIGDGLIIHAPHTGARVRLARLSTWQPIAGTRRVA